VNVELSVINIRMTLDQLYMRLIPGSDTLHDLSQCADHVARWFLANGLLLNPDKTEVIVFGTASRLHSSSSLDHHINIVGVTK